MKARRSRHSNTTPNKGRRLPLVTFASPQSRTKTRSAALVSLLRSLSVRTAAIHHIPIPITFQTRLQSATMANTTPNQAAGPTLLDLLPELLLMILEQLDHKDLGSMRLCCRQMFLEVRQEFARRHLGQITLRGTNKQVERLERIVRLPHMTPSAFDIRGLRFTLPIKGYRMTSKVRWDWSLPSEDSTRRLLNAIPNLREFTLCPPDGGRGEIERRYEYDIVVQSQPILLSALGSLKPEASNLARLTLYSLDFDGAHLLKVLIAHSTSLRSVHLRYCHLRENWMEPVDWELIFFKLMKMDLDELFLEWLFDPDEESWAKVLYEDSASDDLKDKWSSSNPLHRATPLDLQAIHLSPSEYEEVNAPNRSAIFSRTTVWLRRSWVKKGLRILLKDPYLAFADIHLYPDARDLDPVPERP